MSPPAAPRLRNIGPKSAAWLRQVGLRTLDDLAAVGPVEAYMRVRRAGFRPGLNLLYAIEGALNDTHWQEVPDARRTELVAAAEAAIAQLPPPRGRPAAAPVTTTHMDDAGDDAPSFGDDAGAETEGGDAH
ncbi:MAG TPA: TfoX/Sxy family protein [Luteimonas sp.]|nr:TfoX/Sxy family protein [Luteimonas sp.]